MMKSDTVQFSRLSGVLLLCILPNWLTFLRTVSDSNNNNNKYLSAPLFSWWAQGASSSEHKYIRINLLPFCVFLSLCLSQHARKHACWLFFLWLRYLAAQTYSQTVRNFPSNWSTSWRLSYAAIFFFFFFSVCLSVCLSLSRGVETRKDKSIWWWNTDIPVTCVN